MASNVSCHIFYWAYNKNSVVVYTFGPQDKDPNKEETESEKEKKVRTKEVWGFQPRKISRTVINVLLSTIKQKHRK